MAVETPSEGAITVNETPWPPFMIDGEQEIRIESDHQAPHTETQRGSAPFNLPIPDPERNYRSKAAAFLLLLDPDR